MANDPEALPFDDPVGPTGQDQPAPKSEPPIELESEVSGGSLGLQGGELDSEVLDAPDPEGELAGESPEEAEEAVSTSSEAQSGEDTVNALPAEPGDAALAEVNAGPQPAVSPAAAAPPQGEVGTAPVPEPGLMPLMEHLKELRQRLMWAVLALLITTGISFVFAKQVLVFMIAPMGDTMPQALRPTESLGNYMKVALICGVTLAMPVIVYQLGRFLAPGLTKQEKRWLYLLVPGATISFVAGAAFAYFVMLPTAIPFLQGFMSDIIEQSWAIGEYLSFVTSLVFWIGIAFELPLFVFFLAKLGIISPEMLTKNRKYAYLGIAVVAAIITPTVDPLNMLLVMGPLVLLYELGVILAKLA